VFVSLFAHYSFTRHQLKYDALVALFFKNTPVPKTIRRLYPCGKKIPHASRACFRMQRVAVSSTLTHEQPQTTQGAYQLPKTEDAPLPPSPRFDAQSRSLTCRSQRKRHALWHQLTASACGRHGSTMVSRILALHILGPHGPIGLRKHISGVDRCLWQHISGRICWILEVQPAQVLTWFTHMIWLLHLNRSSRSGR